MQLIRGIKAVAVIVLAFSSDGIAAGSSAIKAQCRGVSGPGSSTINEKLRVSLSIDIDHKTISEAHSHSDGSAFPIFGLTELLVTYRDGQKVDTEFEHLKESVETSESIVRWSRHGNHEIGTKWFMEGVPNKGKQSPTVEDRDRSGGRQENYNQRHELNLLTGKYVQEIILCSDCPPDRLQFDCNILR
jgi:hypothetical protein